MKNFLKNILYLSLIGFLAYTYKGTILAGVASFRDRFMPCTSTTYYSLGTFDPRFDLTEEQFLTYLKEAEKKWDDAAGRNILEYRPDGVLKINLIYDKRQEATDALETLGEGVESTRSEYDAMRALYDTRFALYEKEKASFDKSFAVYQKANKTYNAEVAFWNKKGGAPEGEYERLKAEGTRLKAEGDALYTRQDKINAQAITVNSMVGELNALARKLNINVEKYNAIGDESLNEFEEGKYYSGPEGEGIDIYQFENTTKLKRVLAHEFGHALGLEHVEDKDAIMYLLNTSEKENLSAGDLAELARVCEKKF